MPAVYSLVSADWSIERSSGNIRYIGDDHTGSNPSYATGLELHRWLGDLSDDAISVGDDEADRTDPVASKRSTDFIIRLKDSYNIDQTAAEHLYDVTVSQGVTGVDKIIYDGIVVKGNCSNIQVIQNGARLSNNFWNNNGGLNPDSSKGITHRFILKTHDFAVNGGDIDGKRIVGTARNWNKTWKEFALETESGKNVLALDEQDDLNNQNTTVAVGALTGITNQNEGYTAIDADADGSDEYYYSSWVKGSNATNDLYEYAKYLAYVDSAATLYGLPAAVLRGITHQFNYNSEAGGAFSEATAVTFGNGATAQLLALKDDGTTGTMWVQLLTGTAPTNTDSITQGGVTAAVNGTVTEQAISAPFIGVSTGSAIIGGFGLGVNDTLSTADKLTDLSGDAVSPPDVVTFGVQNLIPGQGSVTAYPWDGVSLDDEGNPLPNFSQMTLTSALTVSETSIEVNAIPANTPKSGQLRITLNSGAKRLVSYASFAGLIFTIPATDFSADNASVSNGAAIAYIDKVPASTEENFTYTFTSNLNVVVNVRDSVDLIVPFATSAVLSNTNQSINPSRNSDA